MTLDQAALDLVQKILASPAPERWKLEQVLRATAKWRSQLLGLTMTQVDGTAVRGGPFDGMAYLPQPSEGGVTAKLLGVYEASLQPFFRDLRSESYDAILNVGCAEGYYAVGCARLVPGIPILAWDIDPRAREMCAKLAALNTVESRITIAGEFTAADLAPVRADLARRLGREPRACLIMDCEGAEFGLLDPSAADFSWLDLVVEVHPAENRTLEMLVERFRPTHEVSIKDAETRVPSLPPWLAGLGHLDHLIAVWEWRAVPTPWLILRRRA